jgi:hypothetical protein
MRLLNLVEDGIVMRLHLFWQISGDDVYLEPLEVQVLTQTTSEDPFPSQLRSE